MPTRTITGVDVAVNDEGFFEHPHVEKGVVIRAVVVCESMYGNTHSIAGRACRAKSRSGWAATSSSIAPVCSSTPNDQSAR
jgi:hypothetical protein